ncbi:hypothetical protein B0T10DRAFT_206274 [Thelonectria olida]|uniref:Uncharacterized protein n=1 Tax=Thelonectria olida TaxID=1576542 RepID=A0A9P9AJF6_9HYPO|nr:hypothetical protein B0T10DRAFT_206274 [Thelonectria olida]
MKASLTLGFFLSLLTAAAATELDQRAAKNDLAEMPVVDILSLPDDQHCRGAGDADGHKIKRDDGDLESRASCGSCTPYLCKGRCCRYNKCCKKECCLPVADYCGKDGRCYISC